MSLINRMLRDLSSRERRSADVLSGIQVPHGMTRRGPSRGRLVALLVLVAVFTGALWLLLPRPPAPTASEPGVAAAAPAEPPAAPAASAVAPPPEEPHPAETLRLDTTLSTVQAAAPSTTQPAAQPAVRAATPQRAPRRPAAQAAAVADASSPHESVAPPAGSATRRDARAAAARYAEGRKALGRGDDTSAASAFLAALESDPAHHAAREDLGTLRIRQGRLQEADSLVREGLEREPGWVGYRRLAARLELARNNATAAVALLEHDAPAVAEDPEYHGLLASAYQRLNRHEDAARTYQGLSQLQPGVAQWWAGYGLSRDALGDVPGALAAYRQARTLGGLDPRVLDHINRRSAVLAAGE